MNRYGVNPRWVVHVCAQRGLPALSVDDADHSIASMSAKHADAFRHLISRLHNGHDHGEDLETVAQWIKAAKAQAQEPLTAQHEGAELPTQTAKSVAKPAPDLAGKDVIADPDRKQLLHPERQARQRHSHHVYGKDAALCVEPALIEDTSLEQASPSFHTVLVEMAPAKGEGRFAWENKISIRLTRRELPLFYAVCMGWLPEAEFKNHGTEHDKALVIKDQQNKLFVRVRQGRKGHGVPIPPEELFYVAGLVLKALQSNMPGLDTQAIAMLARRTAAMHGVAPLEN